VKFNITMFLLLLLLLASSITMIAQQLLLKYNKDNYEIHYKIIFVKYCDLDGNKGVLDRIIMVRKPIKKIYSYRTITSLC